MGTPATIIVKRRDGIYASVHCNYDGFVADTGQLLHDHYASQDLAETLIAPGDMSYLGAKSDKPEGHSYKRPAKDHTVYYGRDRDEPWRPAEAERCFRDEIKPIEYETLIDARHDASGQYVYLWEEDRGAWTYWHDDSWISIPEALERDDMD